MQNRQKLRYYSLHVEQDLFNAWCLIKSFGSLISRRGRIVKQVYYSEKDAWDELTKIEYAKRQRGYVYADFEYKSSAHVIAKSKNPQTNTKNKINPSDINQMEFLF
ncbi:MAG: WGR domain-containing protein [Neisseriaceae bacterium]